MEKQENQIVETEITGQEEEDEISSHAPGSSETEPTPDEAEKGMSDPENKNFMELYEESLKSIQEGELVKGEIVQIGKEYILVDIGYKSEGQIPIHEFIDSEGHLTAKVGDRVDVLLEKREDEEGFIILSKEKAVKIKIWDEIREIYEKDGVIRGKVVSRVKGGMSVDIGLQAFLPGSQIDL